MSLTVELFYCSFPRYFVSAPHAMFIYLFCLSVLRVRARMRWVVSRRTRRHGKLMMSADSLACCTRRQQNFISTTNRVTARLPDHKCLPSLPWKLRVVQQTAPSGTRPESSAFSEKKNPTITQWRAASPLPHSHVLLVRLINDSHGIPARNKLSPPLREEKIEGKLKFAVMLSKPS